MKRLLGSLGVAFLAFAALLYSFDHPTQVKAQIFYQYVNPTGRCSAQSGYPIPIQNVTAATSVYYTPAYQTGTPITNQNVIVPQFTTPPDAIGWSNIGGELSNVLANSSTGKAGPAAAAASSVYDLYAWPDGATWRLTRSPAWTQPGAVISNATNNGSGLIRITASGHLLNTSDVAVINNVQGTTEANGTWTVTRISAATFDLQGSTFTNAYVANTGSVASRGGSSGSDAAQTMQYGLIVNNNAITNGPAAKAGTYLCTIVTAGDAKVYHQLDAIDGSPIISVWNNFNQIKVSATVRYGSVSWPQGGTGAWETIQGGGGGRTITLVQGQIRDTIEADAQITAAGSVSSAMAAGIGINAQLAPSGVQGQIIDTTNTLAFSARGFYRGTIGLGKNDIYGLEYCSAATCTFLGLNNSAYPTAFSVVFRM